MVVVEPRVARIGGDDVCSRSQMSQYAVSHCRNSIFEHDQDAHNTAHDEFVLLHLLWSRIFFYQAEKMLDETACKWSYVRGIDNRATSLVRHGQNPLNGDSSIRVDTIVGVPEVVDQQGHDCLPLISCDNTSEDVEIFDGIDLDQWLGAFVLQITGEVF